MYPKRLTGSGMMAFFTNAKSCGISGQILDCISSFLRNRQFLDGKSSQKYSVMQELLKDPFLVLHFSYYTLMTFLMIVSVIFLSMLIILLSILTVIRHHLWQQLGLGSELQSDLWDTGLQQEVGC